MAKKIISSSYPYLFDGDGPISTARNEDWAFIESVLDAYEKKYGAIDFEDGSY